MLMEPYKTLYLRGLRADYKCHQERITTLAVDDLFYTKGPLLAHVDASHALTAFTAVMMSALVIVGLVFRPQGRAVLGLTWVSLGLFMLYVLNTWIIFQHGH